MLSGVLPHSGLKFISQKYNIFQMKKLSCFPSYGYSQPEQKNLEFAQVQLSNQRRQWHPTPVLLPGKSQGWRSLVGCSPWGLEESDMIERLHFHFSLSCTGEGHGSPVQYSCLESPRDGSLVGCHLWGHTESDTTEQLSQTELLHWPEDSLPLSHQGSPR